jgi:hypothetical protein
MDLILAMGHDYYYYLSSIGQNLQLSLDISQLRNLGIMAIHQMRIILILSKDF